MQFAVYPMPRDRTGFIVDVQSRLLEDLATRVVVPLIPLAVAPRIPMKTLNPVLPFNDAAFTPAHATRLESSRLPNPQAIMNDRVNRMEPEQYPPYPALPRNETPPYPRLIGTNCREART